MGEELILVVDSTLDLLIGMEIDMSVDPDVGMKSVLVVDSVVDLSVGTKTIYIYNSLAQKTKNKPFKKKRYIMCLRQIPPSLLEQVGYFQEADL